MKSNSLKFALLLLLLATIPDAARAGDNADFRSYDDAIRLAPNNPGLYAQRAEAHADKNDFSAAIQDFTHALQLDPRNANYYARRGVAFLALNDFELAIKDCSQAIRLNPNLPAAFFARAMARYHQRKYEPAIADFNQVNALNARSETVCEYRGLARCQLGKFDLALGDFNAAIALDPKFDRAYVNRSLAYARKGDFGNAVSDCRRALQLNPTNVLACDGLAWLLATCPDASVRDGRAAVAAATQACELTAWKQWHSLGTLAAACAEAGNFDQAVKYQQQALTWDGLTAPDRAEARQRLALYQHHQPCHEAPKQNQ